MDIVTDDTDEQDFQKKYEILLGEYNSGNNNPEIVKQLKSYILQAMNEHLMPKSQGLYLMHQLSL